MQCPNCHYENPEVAKFCEGCGIRLARVCPHCGHEVSLTAKFCLECGQPLASPLPLESHFASPQRYTPKHLSEKILTSRSALEGERKQVTILFVDVSGFTSISETLDPEVVHQFMNRCFELMLDEVHREECLKLAEPTMSRKNIVKGWRLKGQVFLTQGKLSEAEEALHKALTIAREIGNPPQLWKTSQALGELYERTGDVEQARSAYGSAIQVIEEVAGQLKDQELKRIFLSARPVQEIRESLERLKGEV